MTVSGRISMAMPLLRSGVRLAVHPRREKRWTLLRAIAGALCKEG
jgi:hypothetical protein